MKRKIGQVITIGFVCVLCTLPLIANATQTLYYGGDIITMEGDKANYAEAVIERDGKIVYVGKKSDINNHFIGKTTEVNLKGKTMMPGFIEPHLHPSIAAIMLPNDTIAPHDWTKPDGVSKAAKTPEEYMKRLKQAIDNKPAREGKVQFIWGVSSALAWKKPLTCHT